MKWLQEEQSRGECICRVLNLEQDIQWAKKWAASVIIKILYTTVVSSAILIGGSQLVLLDSRTLNWLIWEYASLSHLNSVLFLA